MMGVPKEKRMESKELLRMNLVACHGMMMSLAEDMRDAPLTFPTANGGCHPMFGTNRLVFLESGLHRMAHRGQLADARRAAGRPRLGP